MCERGRRIFISSLSVLLVAGGTATSRGQGDPAPPRVSEATSPVVVIQTTSRDGGSVRAVLRRPPGEGPFPAAILLHGGLEQLPLKALKKLSLEGVTHVRFLAAGYVTVTPTFRSRQKDPQTPQALWDCLAVLDSVRHLPNVDPESIVVMGGSGGGSLALELAGEEKVAAIAAGEPATVLFTGLLTREFGEPGEQGGVRARPIMASLEKYYTAERQEFTREKLSRIQCPVFIAHGDVGTLKKLNFNYFLPALMDAGKRVEIMIYPGEPHGFYFGAGSPEAAARFFRDVDRFFRPYLKTQPDGRPGSPW